MSERGSAPAAGEGPGLRALLELSRERAAALGREVVAILEDGVYRAAGGERVDIAARVAASVRGTILYDPTTPLPEPAVGRHDTRVRVRNQTTLAAVGELRARGLAPAALNFASATSPGGGFLSGARAQEEYLCRSSALYACLRHQPMYPVHRAQLDPFYADWVVYSPDVPMIRDDAGRLLAEPYPCSFLTAAAVQANAVRANCPEREPEIAPVMAGRIARVLAVAAAHGHDGLVLGAWGCGAFGNDGATIAALFREALEGAVRGVFAEVTFAVTDWSEDERFIGPFRRVFGGGEDGIF